MIKAPIDIERSHREQLDGPCLSITFQRDPVQGLEIEEIAELVGFEPEQVGPDTPWKRVKGSSRDAPENNRWGLFLSGEQEIGDKRFP